jgi:glutaredoxin
MGNIELYTRPGCPFCFALRRRLRKLGIECRETNIWNDPEARDRVRAVANGNETVPTVHIGDRWLVNPTVKDVAAQIRRITTGNSPVAVHHRDDDRRYDRIVVNPPALSPPRTTAKETPEVRHHLYEPIHAAKDIRIFRTTVIAIGTPGIVVAIHPSPGLENYTVEFQPTGLAGATIRVRELTDADLQGRGPQGATRWFASGHHPSCPCAPTFCSVTSQHGKAKTFLHASPL